MSSSTGSLRFLIPLMAAALLILGGTCSAGIELGHVECGIVFNEENLISPRVNGGTDASPGQWPWMVTVVSHYGSESGFCGGTVINREYILTAAHCVTSINGEPDEVRIVAGEHTRSREEPEEQKRKVSLRIVHPSWDWGRSNDIALLKLDEELQLNGRVWPVCLSEPDEELAAGISATVTGWGSYYEPELRDILQQIVLSVVDERKCGIDEPGANLICSTFMGGEGGFGPCPGDSGGPLMVRKGRRWYEHGVAASIDEDCTVATPPLHAYYTKVSAYKVWIDTVMAENRSS